MEKTQKYEVKSLAAKVDNTLLQPFATPNQIEEFCHHSLQYPFASVCIHPCHLVTAAPIIQGTETRLGTVIGFPLGANTTLTKLREIAHAINDGVDELDVVINIGWLKARAYLSLEKELRAIVQQAGGRTVKIIIETCYLDYTEKLEISKICLACGVDYIKTSTGFGTGGATLEDINLLKKIAGGKCMLKAAGGIGTLGRAYEFLNAGADRIGTSKAIAIMNELTTVGTSEI